MGGKKKRFLPQLLKTTSVFGEESRSVSSSPTAGGGEIRAPGRRLIGSACLRLAPGQNRYPPYFMACASGRPESRLDALRNESVRKWELYLLFTLPQRAGFFFCFFFLPPADTARLLKCDPGRWRRLVRGGPSSFQKRCCLISPIDHCLLRSATESLQGEAGTPGRLSPGAAAIKPLPGGGAGQ